MGNANEKTIILLVDDDEIVLDVGSLMLQKLGYKVLQATNGMEAIKVFKDYVDDICLVILDEKLPDDNGSDICKRLKEIWPDVKVLHTSGLGNKQNGDNLECGCDVFLSKPFRIKDLSNKIKILFKNT